MQRQGSLALAIVDARLHEAGVDLAAEVPVWYTWFFSGCTAS